MSELEDEIERLRSRNADLVEILEAVERESGWVPKDTPMPEHIRNMRRELDAALKCCAELREAIESLWPHCDLKAFGGCKPRWLIRALSTDCGKGFYSESEVKPLVDALTEIYEWQQSAEKEWLEAIDISVLRDHCESALAHWRKEEK